jgi:hypothetical protein
MSGGQDDPTHDRPLDLSLMIWKGEDKPVGAEQPVEQSPVDGPVLVLDEGDNVVGGLVSPLVPVQVEID